MYKVYLEISRSLLMRLEQSANQKYCAIFLFSRLDLEMRRLGFLLVYKSKMYVYVHLLLLQIYAVSLELNQ